MDNPVQSQASFVGETPQSSIERSVPSSSAHQSVTVGSKPNWSAMPSILIFIGLLLILISTVFYIGEQNGISQRPQTIGNVLLSIPKSIGIQVGQGSSGINSTPAYQNLANTKGEVVMEGKILSITPNASGGVLTTDIPNARQIVIDMSSQIFTASSTPHTGAIPINIKNLGIGDTIGIRATPLAQGQWRALKIKVKQQ